MSRPSDDRSLRASSQAERAKWAWQEVSSVAKDDVDYRSEALKLPARLLTSGLGQTMAYLHAKSGGRWAEIRREESSRGAARLYSQLARRVVGTNKGRGPMEIIVDLSVRDYRVLGREILETAEWLKRFTEGHIESRAKRARGGSS